jgi:hypothetical protein
MTRAPRPAWVDTLWCVVAAFGLYFCTYGFRKPFTSAGYEGTVVAGLGFKSILVIAQTIGYMLAKFLGIKVVSEVSPARRVQLVLGLLVAAELCYVGYGLCPRPWNAVWLGVNGLSLGLVFGLIVGVLEGRRNTELLAAGLCVSFIVADGVVKSVGAWVLTQGVPEDWMPAAAGLVFVVPMLLFGWMLARVPPPSAADIAERSARPQLTQADRREFFLRYAPGLVMLTLAFLLLTVLRSLRADFMPELWLGLGTKPDSSTFSLTETLIGVVITVAIGSTIVLNDHRRAFRLAYLLAIGGAVLFLLTVLCQWQGWLSAFLFMTLAGLGLYLPYITVHTTIFERLLAMTRDRGNVGFLLYLADAFGYLGYVLVLLTRTWVRPDAGFLDTFTTLAVVLGVLVLGLLIPSGVYFLKHPRTSRDREAASVQTERTLPLGRGSLNKAPTSPSP